MRSKFSFFTGVVLTILGVLMVIADIFNGYMCSCPAQIVGKPNTCFCQPPFGYYFLLIFGIVLAVIGAAFLVIGLLPRRQPPKLESISNSNATMMVLTSLLIVVVATLAFAPILNATPPKGSVNGCTSAFCLDSLSAYQSPSCLILGHGATLMTTGSQYFKGTRFTEIRYVFRCID